jgi:GMP synthase-like glutamine amidotransferase
MRRALAIAHQFDYDPGLIGVAAAAHGIDLVMVAREDRSLPDPLDFDLVIPFGSAWSIAGGDHPQAVEEEQGLLRRAHHNDVPVFGICFGGQQLAAALGGVVRRSAKPEVGPTEIDSNHPLIGRGPWLQFHFDEFDAPPGSQVLARTTSVQAFSINRSVGLQFHPGVTTATVQRWISTGGEDLLRQVGITACELFARCTANEPDAQARTMRLFSDFLEFAGLHAGLSAVLRGEGTWR